MRIVKKDLENMVERLNRVRGFNNPQWDTIGSYKLAHNGYGYVIHKVGNEHGGVSVVANCSGMTCKECYYFLSGLLASD